MVASRLPDQFIQIAGRTSRQEDHKPLHPFHERTEPRNGQQRASPRSKQQVVVNGELS
jgi:hypothetical protein